MGRQDLAMKNKLNPDDGLPSRAVSKPVIWSTDIHVSRWQAGDSEAFRALHDRFAPLLKSRVKKSKVWPMLMGRYQVDDLVQETWARVIPSAQKTYKPSGPGSFYAYLGRLADRTMVDLARLQRAAKRGQGVGDQSLSTNGDRKVVQKPGLPVAETPTSQARCTELESIARQGLNDREYEAWALVEIQGYSAEEAGIAMRCTGSAIRGLLLRCRTKLISRFRRK